MNQSQNGVTVMTEHGSIYKADYVSIGVLQSNLIKFEPDLPVSLRNANKKPSPLLCTILDTGLPQSFYFITQYIIANDFCF